MGNWDAEVSLGLTLFGRRLMQIHNLHLQVRRHELNCSKTSLKQFSRADRCIFISRIQHLRCGSEIQLYIVVRI